MKVGFISSKRGQKEFGEHYQTIVDYLHKKGYDVQHTLEISEKELYKKSLEWREKFYTDFYRSLEHVDVVFVECSQPSVNVGFGLAYVINHGKPVIILRKKGSEGFEMGVGDLISHKEYIHVYEYEDKTLPEVLGFALQSAVKEIDRRFTIIFPSHVMSKLEEISRQHKLPKAVYIRQLIEADLQKKK